MRVVVVIGLAVAVVCSAGAATPVVSFNADQVAPGVGLSVRVAGIRPGDARLVLSPGSIALDPVFRVRRLGTARFRARIPNVAPGEYALSVVRNRRTLARATRPLRIVDPPPGIRGCGSDVYGNLDPNWERGSLRAGPIAFVGTARGFSADYVARQKRMKVLAVVDNRAVATLRVADRDRRAVGLLYAQRRWLGDFNSARHPRNGLPAVRFEGCAPGGAPHTQFNGGFVVDRPRCAHLEVHVRGRAEPVKLAISFGAPC